MIVMVCTTCGEEVEVPEYCPYTGMTYGEGWVYVCNQCRGHLEVKDAETTDATDDINRLDNNIHPFSSVKFWP